MRLHVLLHLRPGNVVDHLEVQTHAAAVLPPATRQPQVSRTRFGAEDKIQCFISSSLDLLMDLK